MPSGFGVGRYWDHIAAAIGQVDVYKSGRHGIWGIGNNCENDTESCGNNPTSVLVIIKTCYTIITNNNRNHGSATSFAKAMSEKYDSTVSLTYDGTIKFDLTNGLIYTRE